MRKLNLAVLFLTSLFFFACGNTENNNNTEKVENSEKKIETTVVEENTEAVENDTKTVEAVKTDDFESFWTNFQTMIANDDKKALLEICNNQSMKDFISGNYESHVNKKMKEVIAKTKASEVKTISETNKVIYYSIEHPSDGPETFSSSFGFLFEKKDGKWWLSEPHMAG